MPAYCITTTLDHDPSIRFSMDVEVPDDEAAIRMVLAYLQMEFDVPPHATYRYRAV